MPILNSNKHKLVISACGGVLLTVLVGVYVCAVAPVPCLGLSSQWSVSAAVDGQRVLVSSRETRFGISYDDCVVVNSSAQSEAEVRALLSAFALELSTTPITHTDGIAFTGRRTRLAVGWPMQCFVLVSEDRTCALVPQVSIAHLEPCLRLRTWEEVRLPTSVFLPHARVDSSSVTTTICGQSAGCLPLGVAFPEFVFNVVMLSLVARIVIGTIDCVANTVQRRRRQRAGCCTLCGYAVGSLTTCPECGTANSVLP